MKRVIILCLLCSTMLQTAFSQSCLEDIFRGSKLLDVGRADQCLALVEPCSRNNQDLSVQWQAYRLMSLAYLLKGQPDSAKISAENMLSINPTYQVNLLKDTREFVNLLQKIVVIPKFSIGLAISAGSNSAFPRITKGYNISDYTKTYTTQNGFQLGTNLGFYINPNWMLEMGFLADNKKYRINYSINDWTVSVKERLTYLDLPVSAKYILNPTKPLRFFASAGVYGGYLLYSQNDFESTHTPSNQQFQLTRLDNKARRNKLNFGLMGGIGAYLKRPDGHFSFTANYYRSLYKINKTDTRYDFTEQIYTYYYVDDDLYLDNVSLSLGYTFYLNYQVYKKGKNK